jgi:hypothetical protein
VGSRERRPGCVLRRRTCQSCCDANHRRRSPRSRPERYSRVLAGVAVGVADGGL